MPAPLAEALLAKFNEPAVIKRWAGLLEGPNYEYHRNLELEPYDTTGSRWHRDARELTGELLGDVRREQRSLAGASMLGGWLAYEDAFVLSRPGSYTDDWVTERIGKRPLLAVRIGGMVLFMSGKGKKAWELRPWMGTTNDPLMTLPYQRKYDTERNEWADEKARGRREKLLIASDILNVLDERLRDIELGDGEFAWPELGDINAELMKLELGFGLDGLGGFFGGVCVELVQLRLGRGDDKPRADFTVADGRYHGVLGGYHRRRSGVLRPALSGASVKWMVSCALDELRDNVSQLAYSEATPEQ